MFKDESVDQKQEQTIEISTIYKRLLFEAMNEALEYFRPYDLRGKPMPWKLNSKKLTFSDIDSYNEDIVFEQARNKVTQLNKSPYNFID